VLFALSGYGLATSGVVERTAELGRALGHQAHRRADQEEKRRALSTLLAPPSQVRAVSAGLAVFLMLACWSRGTVEALRFVGDRARAGGRVR
jgi:hypothetical protein